MLRPTKESTGESSDPASVADGSRNVRNRKSREREANDEASHVSSSRGFWWLTIARPD